MIVHQGSLERMSIGKLTQEQIINNNLFIRKSLNDEEFNNTTFHDTTYSYAILKQLSENDTTVKFKMRDTNRKIYITITDLSSFFKKDIIVVDKTNYLTHLDSYYFTLIAFLMWLDNNDIKKIYSDDFIRNEIFSKIMYKKLDKVN